MAKATYTQIRVASNITEYATSATKTQVLAATTDTCLLTYPVLKLNSAAGAVTTFTVPNGEPGQRLQLISAHANDIEVVPTTAYGWSAATLAIVGDTLIILYLDDTTGWVIDGLMSVIVDTNPAFTA